MFKPDWLFHKDHALTATRLKFEIQIVFKIFQRYFIQPKSFELNFLASISSIASSKPRICRSGSALNFATVSRSSKLLAA